MKSIRAKKHQNAKHRNATASSSVHPPSVPSYTITYHTDSAVHQSEERYLPSATVARSDNLEPANVDPVPAWECEDPLPFLGGHSDEPGSVPSYEATLPCDEKGAKKRQNVAHLDELKAEEAVFLRILLSLLYSPQLHTPCACGIDNRLRTVACTDCSGAGLLCPQCWLNKHRTTPAHWAFVWNAQDQFLEKTDFCRVMKNASIGLGHYGERCPNADMARTFTLVDSNGIHATAIKFCRCKSEHGERGAPEFQQLLQAGIFPGSVKDPKTGYTLGVLERFREERNQGKVSAYNFVRVLERTADPSFAGAVPDIYANFLAVSRFHQHLDLLMHRGAAHGLDVPIPGESTRPYPNRPIGYLGMQCAACPERGVNMPLVVKVPSFLRHLISGHRTLDGNFKANLFFKRDDGSDVALTEGKMYFPDQEEYKRISTSYVIPPEDEEIPCRAHIGSIRHQGSVKYGNTRFSGVIACACDHAVAGSLVDMIKGEAFALGTYAQHEYLKRTNSPPHGPESATPEVVSYDSYCSFVVNQVKRARDLFPDEPWFHGLLETAEGQIPADHINGHGPDCQRVWQAVYFACRAHFHGETAEMIWGFLNGVGSATRQMTGSARHDVLNFVIDAWNLWKVLRQAELLAAQRQDSLRLFELHMAVLEDLSRQHPEKVAAWSRLSRLSSKGPDGKPRSVYQHEQTKVLTIENVLASLLAEEHSQEKSLGAAAAESKTPVAQWVHDGLEIERQQTLIIALLKHHRGHPLQETWDTITKLRNTLNSSLKKFRERQRAIYPRLTLSGHDADEPELTTVQLASYRMKHRQRTMDGATDLDSQLRQAEIKLRCSEADSGIFAVQSASLALSAVRKAREQDYRGQAGITRTQRNIEKAQLMKDFEIEMYNKARTALIHLRHISKDSTDPYPLLTARDTRRKETHLHRAQGDSRCFDGTAWYLQSGVKLPSARVASDISPVKKRPDGERQPELLAGTQMLKRAGGPMKSARPAKRLKDIMPTEEEAGEASASSSEAEGSESDVESSPSKARTLGSQRRQKGNAKAKKTEKKEDGWIWLERVTRGQKLGVGKLAEYKTESDRVQWFRAEAETLRWLEAYERSHAELFRVIARFRRDCLVWMGRADCHQKENGGLNGAVCFARKQAAMYRRLQFNAETIFKSPESGAHHDWVQAETFDELVVKVAAWREGVFTWMDDLDIHRAYKDF
ncbi:hypothetical protein B0H15DRAFT_864492 [Mycena belliarum]|uniref:CxC2-like cysteine cluster KDZ transposase-associated domain-containing protein n=1 Tax=Mycena belliarum TaxID=1033014 RepID=A0AAD6TQI3_9AGAR|nr:hypothetical protein B0H15DRAFT_864492 [Mycena belliae]